MKEKKNSFSNNKWMPVHNVRDSEIIAINEMNKMTSEFFLKKVKKKRFSS